MRAALATYFDLGQSYGISDSAFRPEAVAPPDSISEVGVNSPLGWGTVLPVLLKAPEVMQLWRDAALEQVHRPEIETGWSQDLGSRENFDGILESYIRDHDVNSCDITIFAVGVAYLYLQLGPGVPMAYVDGVLTCFEYAAYTKPVSQEIAKVARVHASAALARADNPIENLTRRAEPSESRDSEGYVELTQFTAFTGLYLCVDEGDEQHISGLLASLGVREEDQLLFEFHGTLHYTWASCVLEPRSMHTGDHSTRMEQLRRMLVDVRQAHVFLGTCDAYGKLVLDEIRAQADWYGGAVGNSVRDHRELNKLRTMALAVVNLTQYGLVTQTDEDQNYFSRFEMNAQIGRKHELISNATEVLYSVQSANEQEELSRRERLLNSVAVVLASLTLVSVMVDSYNFVREQETLLPSLTLRVVIFAILIVLILCLLLVGRRRWRQ
jgi:hypothetical protein